MPTTWHEIVLGVLGLASSGPPSWVTRGLCLSERWMADWMNTSSMSSWPGGMVTRWIW